MIVPGKLFVRSVHLACLLMLFVVLVISSFAQGSGSTLRGQVSDQLGGVVVGASVTIVNANGIEKTAVADGNGIYTFSNLAPGRYTVRASSSGFARYENTEVDVAAAAAGRAPQTFNINLSVSLVAETVTVGDPAGVSAAVENNADAIVLRGKDLDVLPDDPDALASALQAMAGPAAGPQGGQIYIDGFTGGRLPPKETIREVRVNQNPFNAENEQPGFGRIDILTKPGTDKLRGSAFVNMSEERLNSRNPFASERAPYAYKMYGGTLSGTVIPKRASFFLDFQKRDEDENGIVNAQTLDSNLNVTGFPFTLVVPQRRTTFSPRFDYQLNDNHTLVARYTYSRQSFANQGVSELSLPERAYDSSFTQHTVQLTETAVINAKFINETRFQFIRDRRRTEDNNLTPSLIVQDAFFSGGAGLGLAFSDTDRYELQNYTTTTLGNHVLRFGVRLRAVRINDSSPGNFNGTYNFAGGSAPQLDASNNLVLDQNLQPVLIPVTSLERYRRTLALQRGGFTPAEIRQRGGGATQFSISGGNPLAEVSQVDFGGFLQDEWRVRPNLTLGLGLRYETQTNISSRFNFAPRIFFAWAPGGTGTGSITLPGPGGGPSAGQPKTVIRGGFGVFYNRFAENNTLQANRYNGTNQLRFNVTDPQILDLFPAVPSTDTLQGFALQQTTSRIAHNIEAPYSTTLAINVERQLPLKITLFMLGFNYRTRHIARLRNINAPLPGTFVPRTSTDPGNPGVRPFGDVGEIFQFESSGNFNLNQLVIGARTQLNRGLSLFGNYILGKAKSDVDTIFGAFGGAGFPANSYDLSSEYGRGSFDVRHRFIMGGTIGIPKLNLALNPFIIASSGRPFNITTGRDTNGDRLFTERPAFAIERTDPRDLRRTAYGDFDLNPAPGQTMIPRNYGESPGFFAVNLGISRSFGFGSVGRPTVAVAPPSTPASQQAGARPGSGATDARSGNANTSPPQGRSAPASGLAAGANRGAPEAKRYNVTLSVQIQNLFNRSNLSTPVGNLSSPLFGQSLRTVGAFDFGGGSGGGSATPAANRRVEAQLRFNF